MTTALRASRQRIATNRPRPGGIGRLETVALALLLAGLLGGCVIETGATIGAGVAVSGPPPEPVAEARPTPPSAGAAWVPGYWHWTGMQYAWIPGHWEVPPAGARWRAPRYSLRDGTYFYEPGGWNAR